MKVKKLRENAILPTRAHATDAGLDLYTTEDVTIQRGFPAKISTGIAIALPENTVGLILDKSSLGSQGLKVMGGVIDQNYRGDIVVCLSNLSPNVLAYLSAGVKIAQLLVVPILRPEIEEVDDLDATDRGDGGFGSTGC